MSVILLTGGAGLIGSHVARHLIDKSHEVHILDSFDVYLEKRSETFSENIRYRKEVLLRGAHVYRQSASDTVFLHGFLKKINPNIIIHLGNYPLTTATNGGLIYSGVYQSTVSVCAAVALWGGSTRLVYVSSSMVYGDFEVIPVPETQVAKPKSMYGQYKLRAELEVQEASAKFGFEYTIVRPSAVYGPTENNRRVVQTFVESAYRGEELKVVSSPSIVIDFTYVEDVAAGIALAATEKVARNSTFNISYGEGRSLVTVTGLLRHYFNHVRVVHETRDDESIPRRGGLDISRARNVLGYHPVTPLESGLLKYINYINAHNPSLSQYIRSHRDIPRIQDQSRTTDHNSVRF